MKLPTIPTSIGECRDPDTNEIFREAVSAYEANCFRASIVATWTAVVFDFVAKLRELELTNDARAISTLSEYRTIQERHDIARSMKFERSLVDHLEKFELISPQERVDLDRLYEDRNRCAHPSMNSDLLPYDPPEELARLHLVNALNHLLRQPPVQGRVAAELVLREVESDFFPTDVAAAAAHFAEGPLRRAKRTLVNTVLVHLTKATLLEEQGLAQSKFFRFTAAIGAVAALYPNESEDIFTRKLNEIAGAVADDKLHRLIRFSHVVPGAWDALNGAIRGKVVSYLDSTTSTNLPLSISSAIEIPDLKDIALRRAARISQEDFRKIIQLNRAYDFLPVLLERFTDSGSFQNAGEWLALLVQYKGTLSHEHLVTIAQAFSANDQVKWAWGVPEALNLLMEMLPDGTLRGSAEWAAVLSILEDKDTSYFDHSGEPLRRNLQRLGVRGN